MRKEDSEIISLIRNQQSREAGFRKLINIYKHDIYWLIRRLVIDHNDADDLTQEVFIKIWRNLDNFRGDSGLFTWIYRIATNEALGYLKTKKRRKKLGSMSPVDLRDNITHNEAFYRDDETQLRFQRALELLPDKQRLVFNMRYYNEIPYEEMSEILNTSVGALKASYHHAIKKIQKYLTEQ